MLLSIIQEEVDRLQRMEEELEKEISKLPEGKLICARCRNRFKWYQSDGHKAVYISKSKRSLAEKLAMKKYYIRLLEKVKREKKACAFYLKHHRDLATVLDEVAGDNSEMMSLLRPFFKPLSKEQEEWMHAEYETNPYKRENCVYESLSGHWVRSKSELMIDMELASRQLAFRYEDKLVLNGKVFYPDFTIRHPRTDKVIYWEHCGRMDDPTYRERFLFKMKYYIENGILPSVNLIITCEGDPDAHPFDVRLARTMIRQYFGDV